MLNGEFRWFANCFFLTALAIGFFETHRTRMGTGIALIAFGLAASCVVFPPSVVVGAGSYSSAHASLDVGGYLWIAAQAAVLLAVLKKQRKENVA